MATLQDLPSGKKFTVSTWKKELKKSTNYGQLSSLKDNQEVINYIAKKREGAIRGGSYDSSRRRSDYQEILRADSSLTGKDKGSVKGILEHWGTRPGSGLKSDIKKASTKPARRRDPIDFSSDNDGSLFGDSDKSKNKPYGYSPGGSNSAANYFSSSSSSAESKSSSGYKPPRLLR